MAFQDSNCLGCDGLMSLGDPFRRRFGLDQRLQPPIQYVHAGQIVQDALIDADWRGGETVTGFHFHQPETAQRTVRRQGAPMRFGERSHRQTKRRVSTLRTPLGLGALRGELRVHFHAGTQQKNFALEGAQAKQVANGVDGGGMVSHYSRPGMALLYFASQQPFEPLNFGYQGGLVSLGPERQWFRRRHTVKKGPRNLGGVAVQSTATGLSTPSTRSRTR